MPLFRRLSPIFNSLRPVGNLNSEFITERSDKWITSKMMTTNMSCRLVENFLTRTSLISILILQVKNELDSNEYLTDLNNLTSFYLREQRETFIVISNFLLHRIRKILSNLGFSETFTDIIILNHSRSFVQSSRSINTSPRSFHPSASIFCLLIRSELRSSDPFGSFRLLIRNINQFYFTFTTILKFFIFKFIFYTMQIMIFDQGYFWNLWPITVIFILQFSMRYSSNLLLLASRSGFRNCSTTASGKGRTRRGLICQPTLPSAEVAVSL